METNLRTLGANEAKSCSITSRAGPKRRPKPKDVIAPAGLGTQGAKVHLNLYEKAGSPGLVGGRYLFLPPEHGPENLGENNILALASAVGRAILYRLVVGASFHGLTNGNVRCP